MAKETVEFWQADVATLFDRVKSRPEGLSYEEAAQRLTRFGANAITDAARRKILLKIAKRFAEPLVAILLVAAAIAAFGGDTASFVIIVSVVALSIALDLFQEHRAELAVDALKHSVAIRADVRRGGACVSLPVEEIVPGDIVELRAGDLVPADGVLVTSRDLHVNEALMTGEPFPVEKRVGPCTASSPADAFNALFAGTSVVSGEGVMLVIATGGSTRFGGIAAALADIEPPSAFEQDIHRLGLLILRLTVFLVLFVLLAHLAFERPMLQSFLFALALAVGLTPELLPMIMTVTLSRGAIRMAKKSVIVKRLAAIHDLGAMDILCTDKTGTLTEARISLVGHPGVDGNDSERTLSLAALNSYFSTGIRSPLDDAIVSHSGEERLRSWTRLDEIPFDFDRRCVSVLVEHDGERMLVVKGAPEAVLARSKFIDRGDGGKAPLDDLTRARLERMQNDQAELGNRLLGVAWKPVPKERCVVCKDDEDELLFSGYCAFIDPPKEGAGEAIARLERLGIGVKIISGDHEAVVRHIAKSLGIAAAKTLNGAQIAELTDPALAAVVEDTALFARVSPDQKTRIIRALQARGHTVGFLGDGVNDAPAIQAAEVGLSVDGATDVARSAADLIMLSRDLGVLAEGVEEGRRTFANVLKYVRMGTSSNFGNMLSMTLASLALPFLPLLPMQILLNNLLYDISEIGIPFDSVDPDDLSRPHRWDMGDILRFTLVMGALSSVFDFATFAILLKGFHASPDAFRTSWFIESTATQILVIFIIRTRRRFWKTAAHPLLLASSLGALACAFALVASPIGRSFAFVALAPSLPAVLSLLVACYLMAAELTKKLAFPS